MSISIIVQVLSPGSGHVLVLECDDSQANVLAGGDWGVEGPKAPWSESFTCAGQGDTQAYRGDVEDDYYAGESLSGRLYSRL